MTKTFTITESKAQLSALVARVVASGEPVAIGRAGRPMVQLVRYAAPGKKPRRLDAFRKKIQMSADFDRWGAEESKALGLTD
jgi:antitoxin (DNA-binding transcriptional repressor) of toxin-antitoxin stability system